MLELSDTAKVVSFLLLSLVIVFFPLSWLRRVLLVPIRFFHYLESLVRSLVARYGEKK